MNQEQVRNLIPTNRKHLTAKARSRLTDLERMLGWHKYDERELEFFQKEIAELLLMVKPHQGQ
jgi:hypothetical protein